MSVVHNVPPSLAAMHVWPTKSQYLPKPHSRSSSVPAQCCPAGVAGLHAPAVGMPSVGGTTHVKPVSQSVSLPAAYEHAPPSPTMCVVLHVLLVASQLVNESSAASLAHCSSW